MGVWLIDAATWRVIRLQPTGRGAHGLYPSRDGRDLYVSNRGEGSITVISFRTRHPVRKWRLPGGGSPDMGGVSADGTVLWLTGRYDGELYAISTPHRSTAAPDPRRQRTARRRRLAAARPVLDRPHRHHALTRLHVTLPGRTSASTSRGPVTSKTRWTTPGVRTVSRSMPSSVAPTHPCDGAQYGE